MNGTIVEFVVKAIKCGNILAFEFLLYRKREAHV